VDIPAATRFAMLCEVVVAKVVQAVGFSVVSKLVVGSEASETIPLEHLLIIWQLMWGCTTVQLGS
jgi:hypothetical protein